MHPLRTIWLLTSGAHNSVIIFFNDMYKSPNLSIYLFITVFDS